MKTDQVKDEPFEQKTTTASHVAFSSEAASPAAGTPRGPGCLEEQHADLQDHLRGMQRANGKKPLMQMLQS